MASITDLTPALAEDSRAIVAAIAGLDSPIEAAFWKIESGIWKLYLASAQVTEDSADAVLADISGDLSVMVGGLAIDTADVNPVALDHSEVSTVRAIAHVGRPGFVTQVDWHGAQYMLLWTRNADPGLTVPLLDGPEGAPTGYILNVHSVLSTRVFLEVLDGEGAAIMPVLRAHIRGLEYMATRRRPEERPDLYRLSPAEFWKIGDQVVIKWIDVETETQVQGYIAEADFLTLLENIRATLTA